jgi:hypothetical protein
MDHDHHVHRPPAARRRAREAAAGGGPAAIMIVIMINMTVMRPSGFASNRSRRVSQVDRPGRRDVTQAGTGRTENLNAAGAAADRLLGRPGRGDGAASESRVARVFPSR